jgi:hypothetical protein
MAAEVIVRTYTGESQSEATQRYLEEFPRLATDGFVPVTQVWVAGEWPMRYWVAGTILILFGGIGLAILVALALWKPSRTLVVTYRRDAGADRP